jgi:ABC-type uncharacterized transport system substrate-binding protein
MVRGGLVGSPHMRRRDFIGIFGSAAAWPRVARAQQPTIPTVGYVHSDSPQTVANLLAAFREGLSEIGYIEGQNVAIEYRWAQNDPSRIPELVADLVRRRVAVIAAPGSSAVALAVYAGAFGTMDHDARGQPIILPAGGIFLRDRAAIAQALLERRIPSIAAFRENMEAGALISYGFDLLGLFYDIANYVHRIAGGAKPSDMPIEQSPRFYMAINLKTAASLGVALPDAFVARANEVRE